MNTGISEHNLCACETELFMRVSAKYQMKKITRNDLSRTDIREAIAEFI